MTRPAPTRSVLAFRRGLLVLLAVVQVVMTYVLLNGHVVSFVPEHDFLWFPLTFAVWVPAVLVLHWSRLSRRHAVWVVLGVAVLLQVAALSTFPRTSNDDLRYIWDGKVQLAGVDPYRYPPDAPELARLHEPLLDVEAGQPLFAGGPVCQEPTGCPLLNRPDVRTIYPPVAQLAFTGVRVASLGGHGGQLAFQVAGALGSLLITALVLRRCRQTGRSPALAALWGWSPLVVSDLVNNAHIDWLSTLFVLLGLTAYRRDRPAWAGGLIGAAISTKLYPALVLPALLRRRPGVVLGTAAAVLLLGYVPHVIAVGTEVIGYLPGYLHEEGYQGTDGAQDGRLLLLSLLLPRPLSTLLGAVVLLAVALWAWRRGDPDRPEVAAVAVVGVALLVATPAYGWYAALLLALVATSGRWQWLPVVLAPTMVYLYNTVVDADRLVAFDRGIWLLAALATLALTALRAVLQRRAGATGADAVHEVASQ